MAGSPPFAWGEDKSDFFRQAASGEGRSSAVGQRILLEAAAPPLLGICSSASHIIAFQEGRW